MTRRTKAWVITLVTIIVVHELTRRYLVSIDVVSAAVQPRVGPLVVILLLYVGRLALYLALPTVAAGVLADYLLKTAVFRR